LRSELLMGKLMFKIKNRIRKYYESLGDECLSTLRKSSPFKQRLKLNQLNNAVTEKKHLKRLYIVAGLLFVFAVFVVVKTF